MQFFIWGVLNKTLVNGGNNRYEHLVELNDSMLFRNEYRKVYKVKLGIKKSDEVELLTTLNSVHLSVKNNCNFVFNLTLKCCKYSSFLILKKCLENKFNALKSF